ncbi:hypothetical protein PIB30_058743, partial [Stylosanthes scabra]|nr:hypothetical protein [Stylosanthes scabra]
MMMVEKPLGSSEKDDVTINNTRDWRLVPFIGLVDVLTGFNSRLKATFAELDSILEEVIEEHKRKKRNKNISDCSYDDDKDFVDIFLQLQETDMLEFELTGDTMKAILM